MSFLKGLFRGDPEKSAIKHEKRARAYQENGNELKAADEWAAAGSDYFRIPNYKRARECYLQAAQFYLAIGNVNREETVLRDAIDIAIIEGEYGAVSTAFEQLTRIGARLKDDEMLLQILSLKTLIFIAASDLIKAKVTYNETEKVKKRLRKKKHKTSLYLIASTLAERFVEGSPVSEEVKLPDRIGVSEVIDQMVSDLITLYKTSMRSKLTLVLDKDDVKIKEPVPGRFTLTSPIPLQIIQTQLAVPSSIALIEPPNFSKESKKRAKASFVIEANLPGSYQIGPARVLVKVDNQNFNLKSSEQELKVLAAKPQIQLSAQSASTVHSQEEFELLLRVENTSHGDATEVKITITLPPELILRTGTLEKRIINLPAQQDVQFPLYLFATKAGTLEGTIECHYKSIEGKSRKTSGKFSLKILSRERKGKD